MAKPKNNQNKKIADASIAFNAGLAALIFSSQFFPIQHNLCFAILLVIAGVAGLVYGFARWRTA